MPTCPNCAHTFSEEATPAVHTTDNVAVFDDFRALIDDVLAHVRQNPGVKIFSSDNPMTRRIGFDVLETGAHHKRWEISLTRIRGVLHNDTMAFYRPHLLTVAGRSAIARLWTQGMEPTEHFYSAPVA